MKEDKWDKLNKEQDVAEKVRDLIREYLSDYNLEME
jgi:hypothetical protein